MTGHDDSTERLPTGSTPTRSRPRPPVALTGSSTPLAAAGPGRRGSPVPAATGSASGSSERRERPWVQAHRTGPSLVHGRGCPAPYSGDHRWGNPRRGSTPTAPRSARRDWPPGLHPRRGPVRCGWDGRDPVRVAGAPVDYRYVPTSSTSRTACGRRTAATSRIAPGGEAGALQPCTSAIPKGRQSPRGRRGTAGKSRGPPDSDRVATWVVRSGGTYRYPRSGRPAPIGSYLTSPEFALPLWRLSRPRVVGRQQVAPDKTRAVLEWRWLGAIRGSGPRPSTAARHQRVPAG